MLIKEILLKTNLPLPIINIIDQYTKYMPVEQYYDLCDELLNYLHNST